MIEDFDNRNELERWLLNWSGDSDVYPSSALEIEKIATYWRVRFRDARTGKFRTVHLPIKDTPAPPGWKEGK